MTFRQRKRRGLVLGGFVLFAVGAAAWWAVRTDQMQSAAPAERDEAGSGRGGGKGTGGGRRSGQRAAGGPAAVTTTIAVSQDVPVSVEGIGTVQAYNSVTVRARVDGEIVRINFSEGQDVAPGDVLAQIDPRPYVANLAQARAFKAKDEAVLANAQLDLRRDQELSRNSFIAQKTTDTQKALVAQLEASLQSDQATIDNAILQLSYATVRAPIAGRTGIRLIDQGNIVSAADRTGIVTITQLQPISVLLTLPQQSLPAVSKAQAKGTVAVLALDMDRTTELERGYLAVVDNQIDPQTGTYKLKATMSNANRTLWPGQFVNARLELDHLIGVVVPAVAVQRDGDHVFVYIVESDQTVARRTIKVAQVEQDRALIDAGLEEGARVVISGQEGLRPGVRVADIKVQSDRTSAPLTADEYGATLTGRARNRLIPHQ